MKVLILISGNDSGGAAKYILNLCSLQDKDIEIILGCIGDGFLYEAGKKLSITTVLFSGKSLLNKEISNYSNENSIDIVNFNGAKLFLTYRLIRRNLKAICVATVHSDYRYDFINSKLKQILFTPLSVWGLKGFSNYISVSRHLEALLHKEGIQGKNYIVSNGIDNLNSKITSKYENIRATYGIKETEFLIVSVARFHPVKNHGKMLEGFSLLASEYPDAKLICVGDGDQKINIENKILELKLKNKVVLVGFQNNTMEFFAAGDISILTSLSEAGDPPIVVLESGIASKPVICSKIGNLDEIIKPEYGYLVDPEDSEDIYFKMKEAYINKTSLAPMGKEFNNFVKNKFSIEVFYKNYREVFLDLLKNGRS